MKSPVPLQPGRTYHIYNRGNNRENIFVEERNYRYFLKLYAKYILPIADTYAYCLLRNHFHLLIRVQDVQEPSPSRQFSNLFNAYAKAVNKAYDRTGSLFQRPFGRIEVTSERHFTWLVAYIHLNPQKHRFVDDFRTWPYSSYHAMLSDKPSNLNRDEVLAWFDGADRFEGFHHEHGDLTGLENLSGLVVDDFD